ncbi:Glutaminyl-tRNA synthetase [hydrothermal vent metagenome]|uniref:glutamine--tRNA ligase n=1 Tax=hydrothermal vent metagenome TaxID=652676 RepID=A0A3B0VTX0_9ZZZZ
MQNMSAKNVSENFITQIIDADLKSGKHQKIITRFPPEPNGFLHVGHVKSICLNFGLAADYGGQCNLRFDDTNPAKESVEYAQSIQRDIKWLGFSWGDTALYASDYFEQIYTFAEELIGKDQAYIDQQSPDEIRENRGDFNRVGINSPYRNRPSSESLDLFRRMKAGEFADGKMVLRAKIDMQSGNINLRDPVLYRIKRAHHIRTGDTWCIYPMYDFTHCISDAIEGITHSICTLEFEDHRPLYDWVLDNISIACHPQQIEFNRLNQTFTITSKRKLNELVEKKQVDGWDDPRMPTVSGMRRRGYTPQSIREYAKKSTVTKKPSLIPMSMLEDCVRKELNTTAPRIMGVLRPLKVVIENYPEGQTEMLKAQNHPLDESFGSRDIPFARELYIEAGDYKENANRKFFRFTEGREVRLRYAYYLTCQRAIKNADGVVIELRCTYDPQTKGGTSADGRKVKGTIHWVTVQHADAIEVRLYDRLFNQPAPVGADDLNPESLEVLTTAKIEPNIIGNSLDIRYQFERLGYFYRDPTHEKNKPVFNRIVTLRDSWAKIEEKMDTQL